MTLFRALARTGLALAAALALAAPAAAQLRITVTGGDFRPIALAMPAFLGDDAQSRTAGDDIARVVEADLTGSGLFRVVPREAHIETIDGVDATPDFPSWAAINAEALVVGHARVETDGRISARFRLYDVAAGRQMTGFEFFAAPQAWRRIAHKISDAIYAALTGEEGYFDSRIVFVDETGPKGDRVKRLALIDQDGANLRYLSDGRDLVLMPRFSPTDQTILFISYATGEPQIYLYNIDTGQRELLGRFPGMSFAPRFAPDGRSVLMSLSQNGNTDIFLMELATRTLRRLTSAPSIETSPSFSPDGSQIVFESDRGGQPQIYVMDTAGDEATARRISFGDGRYGTPVWSPRGDLIAFTKQSGGRFSVGVMRADGGGERELDGGYHAEGPTWAPNGRVLAYFKESPGERGSPTLWAADIAGLNRRRLDTPNAASDPAWSPLLP